MGSLVYRMIIGGMSSAFAGRIQESGKGGLGGRHADLVAANGPYAQLIGRLGDCAYTSR